MLHKLTLIIDKIILGITLAAPIGPVSAEMIRRGLQNGFWAAFNVRLGGVIGNTLCLVITYLGLSQITSYPGVMHLLGLLGAGLLFYMGFSALLKSGKTTKVTKLQHSNFIHNGILCGLYLAIINPVALVFWSGIFAASMEGVINVTGFLLNLFIILGVLIWGLGLSLGLAVGKKQLNPKIILLITKFAALLMILYGVKYLYYLYFAIF